MYLDLIYSRNVNAYHISSTYSIFIKCIKRCSMNDREFRTAMTILQTWLGQIENVKVLETPTTVSAVYIWNTDFYTSTNYLDILTLENKLITFRWVTHSQYINYLNKFFQSRKRTWSNFRKNNSNNIMWTMLTISLVLRVSKFL